MPSYNISKTLMQILRLDPSIFDGDGGQLGFSCDGYQVTIHILGNGQLEIASINPREEIHMGPYTLEEAHKAMTPIVRPETYAVLSMLLERYQQYRQGIDNSLKEVGEAPKRAIDHGAKGTAPVCERR